MKRRFLVLIPLFLILFACSKPVPESKINYVGEWQSSEMALLISRDGRVAYKRVNGSMTKTVNGPIKKFSGNDFVVGFLFLTTTFKVSEPPNEKDGRWQMVVDGVRLTRTEG